MAFQGVFGMPVTTGRLSAWTSRSALTGAALNMSTKRSTAPSR